MSLFTKFSLKNAAAIFIITFLLMVGGVYSFSKLKIDLLPNMDVPALIVQVMDPGATASDMEEQVNKKLEPQIKMLSALDTYQTNSSDNASFYILQFDYGTDMDKAEKELNDAIDKLKLPEKATTEVTRFTMGSIPIVNASLEAKGDKDIQEILQGELADELERVDGINSIQYFGRVKPVVDIEINKQKALTAGITIQQIQEAIQKNKLGFPVGVIKENDTNVPVRLEKDATVLKELLIQTSGKPVKLGDIATIKNADVKSEYGRYNGSDVVLITATKTQNGNTVEVTDKLIKVLKKYKKDVSYNMVYEQADSIKLSVKTLVKEGLFGALFASLTILVFLRSFRATLISIISIPLSLLITAIFLHKLDITLNMMTLGAMAVAVGRVVDDSIVVIENIYRRMKLKQEGQNKNDLVIVSTKEILSAITASTITTAVVFLPIGLVGGMSGEIFMPFALTVVIALFASLLVAVTLVPILAKISFKEDDNHDDKPRKMENFYSRVIQKALNHKVIVIVVSLLLLISSFTIVPRLGFTFLPNDKQKLLSASVTLPSATPIETTNDLSKKVEEALEKNKNIKDNTVLIGLNGMGFGGTQENAVNYYINLKSEADVDKETKAIQDTIEKTLPKTAVVSVQSVSSGGPPSGNGVTIDLYNNDLAELQEDAAKVERLMKKDNTLKTVENTFADKKKQYTISLNNTVLEKNGLQAEMVMGIVASQLQNVSFSLANETGKEINYELYFDKAVTSQKDLNNLFVIGAKGPIPLSKIASIKSEETYTTIQKSDGKIYAQISAETTSKNIQVATENVKKDIKKSIKLHENTKLDVGGGSDDAVEAFGQLGMAMLVAVGLVYLTMLITFGKARIPFVILSSLLFVPIGALGGLWITGEPLSISVMIGILMLIGIVTTNAIVFVDRVGQNRYQKSMAIRDSLIEAGKTRLRPILMTAIATITALLPLAISTAGGTLISKGLAIVVIGGLTTSTLLTLIVLPVLYEIFFFKTARKERQSN
ncbi:multidrug transporter AcrB [Priestia megaterium]|nr:multidrug transporter AcrB [Priestia megaterium]